MNFQSKKYVPNYLTWICFNMKFFLFWFNPLISMLPINLSLLETSIIWCQRQYICTADDHRTFLGNQPVHIYCIYIAIWPYDLFTISYLLNVICSGRKEKRENYRHLLNYCHAFLVLKRASLYNYLLLHTTLYGPMWKTDQ